MTNVPDPCDYPFRLIGFVSLHEAQAFIEASGGNPYGKAYLSAVELKLSEFNMPSRDIKMVKDVLKGKRPLISRAMNSAYYDQTKSEPMASKKFH
jgi:hypothetical protein